MTTGWKDPKGLGRSPAEVRESLNPTKKPEPLLKDGEIAHGFGRASTSSGGSRSGSTSFDHSAIDEARSARSKANQIKGTAAKSAYDGDISGVMNAANSIRGLQQQAREADKQGVRIRSVSSRSSDPGSSSKPVQLSVGKELPKQEK